MTVHRREDGVIVLAGVCAVEDAESLLQLLQVTPGAVCDWTRCNQLHTAVVQALLMAGASMTGPCGDAWIEQWMEPEIARQRADSAGQP